MTHSPIIQFQIGGGMLTYFNDVDFYQENNGIKKTDYPPRLYRVDNLAFNPKVVDKILIPGGKK